MACCSPMSATVVLDSRAAALQAPEEQHMADKKESGRDFTLRTLRQHADRELQVADLHDLCGGRYSKENLQNVLAKLLLDGIAERTVDPNRNAFWAITSKGLAEG